MTTGPRTAGRSPDAVDGPLASATRFLSELATWVAAPWAASRVSVVLAVAVLVVVAIAANLPRWRWLIATTRRAKVLLVA